MVGSMVFVGRLFGCADDQHDPVLQLQRYSMDAEAACVSGRNSYRVGRDDLGIFGVRAGYPGLQLCRGWRCPASGALRAAPAGFADCVIHAFV